MGIDESGAVRTPRAGKGLMTGQEPRDPGGEERWRRRGRGGEQTARE